MLENRRQLGCHDASALIANAKARERRDVTHLLE